jgi:acid phosphatase (class A)
VALQVAGLVVAYFKLKYERARPAQVWTAISPVIPTPAHPSYPGGHALQAHLIAKCVEWIVPAMRPACKVLATRIAENRELAGLHWPSDTEASVKIVQRTFELLSGVEQFIEIVKIAKDEWGTPTEFSPPTPPHVGDTKVPLS